MFIRVVLLINIDTNNSYITTLQQLSVCIFLETISTKCQATFYTPHPQSTVNIDPSQDYTRLEVSLIETPFPCQPHLCLYINPPNVTISCSVGQPPVIVGQPDCYTWFPSGQPPSNQIWQALHTSHTRAPTAPRVTIQTENRKTHYL